MGPGAVRGPDRPLEAPPKYRDPSPDPEVISFVNASLSQAWAENGVKPADPATDEEWCRRLFVRVLGRIPNVEGELRPFLADSGEPVLGASDEVVMEHIRSRGSAGHHFVGSCRMGPDEDAVVDPRLRVNKIGRLRVVDGSIMPSITSGNTLAPIVMIAEKGATMILEDGR